MTSSSGDVPPELPKSVSSSLHSYFGSLAGEAAQPSSAGSMFLQDVRSSTSYGALRGLVDFLTICCTALFALGCVACLVASIASCTREGSGIPMNPGFVGGRSSLGGPELLILSFFSAFGALAMQLVRRGAVLLVDMADMAIWHGRKASASGQEFLQQLRAGTSYRVLRRLIRFVSTILIWLLLVSFVLGILTSCSPNSDAASISAAGFARNSVASVTGHLPTDRVPTSSIFIPVGGNGTTQDPTQPTTPVFERGTPPEDFKETPGVSRSIPDNPGEWESKSSVPPSQVDGSCFSLLAALFVLALYILLAISAKHAATLLVDMADLAVWHGSRSAKDRS